jgi:immune inhibitor A
MNPRISAAGAGAALLLTGALVPASAVAAPSAAEPDPATHAQHRHDDRPDALADKQRERKQQAVEMVATGEAKVVQRGKGKHKSDVVEIAPGEYVEYGAQRTSQLFSILVEFGDGEGSPFFPDSPAGPLHNEIPEPSADDNSTYWESDFSRSHFMDMFFHGDANGESFRDVYDEMSSGRFDLQGDVSEWVTVPHRGSYYGAGNESGLLVPVASRAMCAALIGRILPRVNLDEAVASVLATLAENLLFGTPGETDDDWRETLETVLAAGTVRLQTTATRMPGT